MDQAGVLTAAEAHSDTASDAVRAVINTEYLRFTDAELLSFAQTFETHARLVFTAQEPMRSDPSVRTAGDPAVPPLQIPLTPRGIMLFHHIHIRSHGSR